MAISIFLWQSSLACHTPNIFTPKMDRLTNKEQVSLFPINDSPTNSHVNELLT
ncbi:hypothetical protein Patl1_27777 [Pistacia atlantica]|uniref:Uncharacterized protein n=1 Tax=Pistacia atlantica TaxID=434234 RepID=A0ACC1BC69_9ROSI|nr:hypothetical protein Patl1_27777 [Pistacia atlantica]